MQLKSIISAGLVFLIAVNGLVGGMGSLLVCLHETGPVHLADAGVAEDCCHDSAGNPGHECHTCTDLKLQSIDVLATRVSDEFAPLVALCESSRLAVIEDAWQGPDVCEGANPTRAPPGRTDICLLVAQTVVLRV